MSSSAFGSHSGAGPLSLMSCVRESSPLQSYESDTEKNVAPKKKFWNPKKWFKRKNKASEDVPIEVIEIGKDILRSRSTSELSVAEECRRRSSSSMYLGLSASHDSVFHSPNSGSDVELNTVQSSSSLSISQPLVDLRLQTELCERLRLRRVRGDTSEDDEGFPHSPCNSPITTDGLLDKTAIKDLPTKSHSTCSDGSLLSMESYEMDEETYGSQSRHSSKVSLHDRKSNSDSDLELEFSTATVPLNHSAAHHRVSVRPKRTYGAPRRKKGQQLPSVLPATPEVNEDSSIRSVSPDNNRNDNNDFIDTNSSRSPEVQLKCFSLPPSLTTSSESTKLNRSKSNTGSKSRDRVSPLHEDAEKEDKLSLFERIFPRKSGKKKKLKEEKLSKVDSSDKQLEPSNCQILETDNKFEVPTSKLYTESYESKSKQEYCRLITTPHFDVETHPSTRITSDKVRRKAYQRSDAEKQSIDALELEDSVESQLRQRHVSPSTSPSKSIITLENLQFPRSPVLSRSSLVSSIKSHSEYTHYTKTSISSSVYSESKNRNEDLRSKIRIAGLSPLQQRVISLNDDEIDNFKSLTEIVGDKVTKPVMKSHSFKSAKQTGGNKDAVFLSSIESSKNDKIENRTSIVKAVSLDSVKNFEHQSDIIHDLTPVKRDATNNFIDKEILNTAAVKVTHNYEEFSSVSKKINRTSENDVEKDFLRKTASENSHVSNFQLKHEVTDFPKPVVPEFLQKQLNKVEINPESNVILSIKSPKIIKEPNNNPLLNDIEEQDKKLKSSALRKFSKENLEIIEKDDKTIEESSPESPTFISVTSTSTQANRYRKNETKSYIRKSSTTSITSDSSEKEKLVGENNECEKPSQDVVQKFEDKFKDPLNETVILRRKSLTKKKNDEEPELMKVFARRSLKLKDSDVEQIQDNLEEKTRINVDENQRHSANEKTNQSSNETEFIACTNINTDETTTIERKMSDASKNARKDAVPKSPVPLRTINNVCISRAVSLNQSTNLNSEVLDKKPVSFAESRNSDNWLINIRNEEVRFKERMQEEIIKTISQKSEFIKESNNFSERKAAWEKRAQQAQKKYSS